MRDFWKKNKWTMIITSVIILIPIVVGMLLWDKLPDKVPYHWGVNGEVDGWATKSQAVFLMPLAMLGVQWFCAIVTQLDPKRQANAKMMWL